MEDQPWDADGPEGRACDTLLDAIDLENAGKALDFRVARLLAVLKRMDVAPLGYGSFRAFCDGEVEWKDTHIRQLVRLVESPFAHLRAAVAAGKLPPSVAVRALHEIEPKDEVSWLAVALAGELPRRPRRQNEPRREWTGEDAKLVHAARTLARLHLGQPVSDSLADHHILETWRARKPRKMILDEALEKPPPPAPLPEWMSGPDPADSLVGPWQQPVDVHHARSLLHVVQLVRRERVLRLGETLDRISGERLFAAAGYRTMEAWVRENLSIDIRTVQRLRRAAVLASETHLDLDRIDFIDNVATDDTREEWLQIVPMVGLAELRRARVLVTRGDSDEVLRAAYLDAIREATKTAEGEAVPWEAAAWEVAAANATRSAPPPRRLYVSLAATLPPPPAPRHLEAHPDLLEAAVWFLKQGRLPRQHGIGRIKEEQAYTCVIPECAGRSGRAHVHHRVPRSEGGSDARENLHPECPSCHLRVVHGGYLSMERRGDQLVFRFHDRQIHMFGYFGKVL